MSQTMTPDEVERDLTFAIAAARSAGERALSLRIGERWEGRMLADVGDQACDGYLQGLLQGRYPDDGILSEETADSPRRLEKTRTWIIDPLDGTREYSQLRHDWAVHVALTLSGETALAAVALPAQDLILWGVSTEEGRRSGLEGSGELVSGDSQCPESPRVAVSRSHTPPWVETFTDSLGGTMVPEGSAGNKVSLLLLGRADIYVHKTGLKEWDTCAPETVARSLGWTVCKLRGEEHRYNQPDPKNHELVICRPEWKERVVEAIAASGALE
jgi:3'(2'), 5'-bisphosphate nucleotidase